MLRCYAEKEDGLWVAVCVDLCLAAQGETVEEARKKLHSQIHEYLHDVLAGPDQQHAGHLLRRKAPLAQVAKYHLLRAGDALHLLSKSAYSLFSEVCPVTLKQVC